MTQNLRDNIKENDLDKIFEDFFTQKKHFLYKEDSLIKKLTFKLIRYTHNQELIDEKYQCFLNAINSKNDQKMLAYDAEFSLLSGLGAFTTFMLNRTIQFCNDTKASLISDLTSFIFGFIFTFYLQHIIHDDIAFENKVDKVADCIGKLDNDFHQQELFSKHNT